ncbi:Na+/H+ antiporter subunit E [Wolbachia endosymbiont of Pentidionis agamae]|uniref:Na+/H+ antiporter subunit E n=1 Tax=Wolbachia endosymbiont of Pentidionis agamae TaxID=3110435 RepID=UPI002FD00A5C
MNMNHSNLSYTICLFISLLILWVILSGHFGFFFISCGIASCILTAYIAVRLLNATPEFGKLVENRVKLSPYQSLKFIIWLFYQMILSSIYVIKKILQTHLLLKPVIISIKSKQPNNFSAVLFSSSLTITPGTLTIFIKYEKNHAFIILSLIDKELKTSVSVMEEKFIK